MYAVGIGVVLLLAFAAFDDITTDHDASFALEYAVLAGCALWLFVIAGRLLLEGRRALGAGSLVALAGAVWAQADVGPGIVPGPWPGYLTTAVAFLWFAGLAVVLFFGAHRPQESSPARSEPQPPRDRGRDGCQNR
jgi:hypothetical protein